MVCDAPARPPPNLIVQCDHPGGILVTVTTAGPRFKFVVHSQPPMIMGKQFAAVDAGDVSAPLQQRMRSAFGAAVTDN